MFSVVATLHAPKEGNSEEQYEDAFAFCAPETEVGCLYAAVADGASSAIFAREWAQLLVQRFSQPDAFPTDDPGLFVQAAPLGVQWRSEVTTRAKSWYAQERLPSGSAASLLVVVLDAKKDTLSAVSIGDVCLFLIRNDRLKFGFPKTRSRQFDDRPALLTTEVGTGTAPLPQVLRFDTPVEPGDRCLLMTDAMAQYFLAEFEAKRQPWRNLPQKGEFAAWLKQRRDAGTLKNDDVTLVEVSWSGADKPIPEQETGADAAN